MTNFKSPISLRKKLLLFSYYLIAIPVILELVLLVLGYRRYINEPYSIESSPKLAVIAHPEYGFSLNPGNYQVTINKGLSYQVSHGEDSLRETPFVNKDSIKNGIYLFGCSYTYGMGVNDNETFAAYLQQKLPNYQVKNYGVPGYGIIQSYLQLKELARLNKNPAYIIVNYASFHDERNALTPQYRKHLKLGYELCDTSIKNQMKMAKMPFIKAENGDFSLEFCEWSNIYSDLPGRQTFASINLLQNVIDNQKTKSIPKEIITLYLFKSIHELATVMNAKLIVTGLTNDNQTRWMLHQLKKFGFNTLSFSIDLDDKAYNNLPYDIHPNASAHKIFGEELLESLTPILE